MTSTIAPESDTGSQPTTDPTTNGRAKLHPDTGVFAPLIGDDAEIARLEVGDDPLLKAVLAGLVPHGLPTEVCGTPPNIEEQIRGRLEWDAATRALHWQSHEHIQQMLLIDLPNGRTRTKISTETVAGLLHNQRHTTVLGPGIRRYYGPNPFTPGYPGGRPRQTDIARFAGFPFDLDAKEAACRSFAGCVALARAIEAVFGDLLITLSGRGFNAVLPFMLARSVGPDGSVTWVPAIVDDTPGSPFTRVDMIALCRRVKEVVQQLAAELSLGKPDGVTEPTRVLRQVGGLHGGVGTRVSVLEEPVGDPITLDEILAVLDERVPETPRHRHVSTVALSRSPAGTVVVPADTWPLPTDHAGCRYFDAILRRWSGETPSDRHPWAMAECFAIPTGHRYGCLTAQGLQEALGTLQGRFEQCCREGLGGTDPREPRSGEFEEMLTYAYEAVAAQGDEEFAVEVAITLGAGGVPHLHEDDPDNFFAESALRLLSPAPSPNGQVSAAAEPVAAEIVDAEIVDGTAVAAAVIPSVQVAIGPKSKREVRFTKASDIPMTVARFAWTPEGWAVNSGMVPVGELTILAGREGLGKSVLCAELIAQVTTGRLPGYWFGRRRGVIVAADEDSWTATIVPRLRAAGADLDLVHRADTLWDGEENGAVEITVDIPAVESFALDHDAGLVVFDPLINRLGNANTDKQPDVMGALQPLVSFAQRTGVAALGLLHVNKSGKDEILDQVMSSKAFTTVPRAVIFLERDSEDTGLLHLALVKANLSRKDQSHPTLRIVDSGEIARLATGEVVTAGRVQWVGTDDRSMVEVQAAGRAAAASKGGETTSRTAQCQVWLHALLVGHEDGGSDGPGVPHDEIEAAAELAEYSTKMLLTARKRLGVQVLRGTDGPGTTRWRLAGQENP